MAGFEISDDPVHAASLPEDILQHDRTRLVLRRSDIRELALVRGLRPGGCGGGGLEHEQSLRIEGFGKALGRCGVQVVVEGLDGGSGGAEAGGGLGKKDRII